MSRQSRAATIIYRHILLGENLYGLIRTRTHEKTQIDFFRAELLCVLYIAGKNVKNCKVTCIRDFFRIDLMLHLIEVWLEKHGG